MLDITVFFAEVLPRYSITIIGSFTSLSGKRYFFCHQLEPSKEAKHTKDATSDYSTSPRRVTSKMEMNDIVCTPAAVVRLNNCAVDLLRLGKVTEAARLFQKSFDRFQVILVSEGDR